MKKTKNIKEISQDIKTISIKLMTTLEQRKKNLILELKRTQQKEIEFISVAYNESIMLSIDKYNFPYLLKDYIVNYPSLGIFNKPETDIIIVPYSEDIFENAIKKIKEAIKEINFEQYDISKRIEEKQ